MSKQHFGTFLLVAVCAALLLVSYASADEQKPEEKLIPFDNVPAEVPLEAILDGLRVRRSAQGGGQGSGSQQGPGNGQGGQRGGGQGGQNGGGQSGQSSAGN